MDPETKNDAVEAVAAMESPGDGMEPHEAEHYGAIQRQAHEVERLAEEAIEAKEAASDAKKAYEGAVSTLRNIIRRGPDPQAELPFGEREGGHARLACVSNTSGPRSAGRHARGPGAYRH